MIEISPATDEEVFEVMADPAIWDAISDDGDGEPSMGVVGQTSEWIRLAGRVGGKLIGVIMLHDYEDGEMIHVNVLPGFRTQYAPEFVRQSLQYAVSPTYAEIPDSLPNIQRFAEHQGFVRVSGSESIGQKNGKQYQLGLYKRVA